MPFIPTVPMAIAPAPTERLPYPWRFTLGQHVYALGHFDSTLVVTGGELWLSFPHLHLLDVDGKTWRIPQIHCSPKPLTPRA